MLRDREATHAWGVRIRDLGLGGACVAIPGPADPGAAVEATRGVLLEVLAPTLWDPLVLEATIAWVRRGAAGSTLVCVRFNHREGAALFALLRVLGAQGSP